MGRSLLQLLRQLQPLAQFFITAVVMMVASIVMVMWSGDEREVDDHAFTIFSRAAKLKGGPRGQDRVPGMPMNADAAGVNVSNGEQLLEVAATANTARWDIDLPPCAINPSMFYEASGMWVPECRYAGQAEVEAAFEPQSPSLAYVLSLPGKDRLHAFQIRERYLAKHGVKLQRFPAVTGSTMFASDYSPVRLGNVSSFRLKLADGSYINKGEAGYLTAGERGYLASMKRLLEEVLRDESLVSVLVVDDDVLFSCSFQEDLAMLLADTRCGAITQPEGPPSVLLLGSAIWIPGRYPRLSQFTGGWGMFEEEIRMHQENTGSKSMCVNANSKNFGTFAVIYHRSAIPAILRWIETATKPFDHMFSDITGAGVYVRTAWPFVAIQDVRHASQIDPSRQQQENLEQRAMKHRWNLTRFCDVSNGRPLAGGDPAG